jgi:hypothetical protein
MADLFPLEAQERSLDERAQKYRRRSLTLWLLSFASYLGLLMSLVLGYSDGLQAVVVIQAVVTGVAQVLAMWFEHRSVRCQRLAMWVRLQREEGSR